MQFQTALLSSRKVQAFRSQTMASSTPVVLGNSLTGGWLRNAVKQPEVAGHHLARLIRWGHSVKVGLNCGTSKKEGGTDGSAPPRVLRGTHTTLASACLLVHELFLNHITIRTIAANLNDDLAELVNGEMACELRCKERQGLLQFESCVHTTDRQITISASMRMRSSHETSVM